MDNALARVIKFSLLIGITSLWLLVALAGAQETLPNGVAAGDTGPTSTVLWARGTTPGAVLFEYSTDPNLASNVSTVTATIADSLQPVKVPITGLSPATTYYYRATDADAVSARGQFRTAASAGTHSGLRFGASGDWKGELAPYPSIANADERDLDFFVEHGDTIAAGSATSLSDYRLKHDEVYGNHLGFNTWADLRASTSILATIDDNDVMDNFAGGADPASNPNFDNTGDFINETQRYANALQAFQEYNPLRDEFYAATGDPRTANKRRLYRHNTYGRDAAVFLLDTRSFRDEQLPAPTSEPEVIQFLSDSLNDTSRTMLGAKQLADLKAGLGQAQADGVTWKFVLTPGAIQNLGIYKAEDRFEGYAAERNELLRFIHENGIQNAVFIAAGLHGTIVNNLTYQDTLLEPQIPTGAFEIIVGPVAIDPPSGPFGPVAVDRAQSLGAITPAERADYDARTREGKDEFVRQLIDEELLEPLGYDGVGLDGSEIDAELLQGGYVAAHTYGWTEFEVDEATQALMVTTYGVDFYTEAELVADPGDILTRTPAIISQFVVTPTTTASSPVLSISQSVDPSSGSRVRPGDWITYTLTAVNSGTANATRVVISDTLDPNLNFVDVTPSTDVSGPNPLVLDVGVLPGGGGSVNYTVRVTVANAADGTAITNAATLASDETVPQESNAVSHVVSVPSYIHIPVILRQAN